MASKPEIHVEIVVTLPHMTPEHFEIMRIPICKMMETYLHNRYVRLPIHKSVLTAGDKGLGLQVAKLHSISFEEAEGREFSYKDNQRDNYNLNIHVCWIKGERLFRGQDEEAETSQTFEITTLPHEKLLDSWSRLTFDDNLHERLVQQIVNTVSANHGRVMMTSMTSTGPILLSGVPGTGKSSLCMAIANKAAIRLSHIYPSASLIEVNAAALLDQYVGGSQKLVNSLFFKIQSTISGKKTLCFVLLDEVESVAATRKASHAADSREYLSATNRVLTVLDRLKQYPQVILLCTSNLEKTLDPAFISRLQVIEEVPLPGYRARYKILRTAFLDLVNDHKIIVDLPFYPNDSKEVGNGHIKHFCTPFVPQSRERNAYNIDFSCKGPEPLDDILFVELQAISKRRCLSVDVYHLARLSAGLSGRVLERLPFTVLNSIKGQITVRDAVKHIKAAIEKAIRTVDVSEKPIERRDGLEYLK